MIYAVSDEYLVRPLLEGDLDGPNPGWFEDHEVCWYNSHGKFFKTHAYFREYLEALDREDRVVWAICHTQHGHIDNISLQGISLLNRSAEFATLLGDKRHWGRDVGRLAGRVLLAHGFSKLNLKRIHCGTAASNDGISKLARLAGMKLEGTPRKHSFPESKPVNVLRSGILWEEHVV